MLEIWIDHHIVNEDTDIEPWDFSPDHLNYHENANTDSPHTIFNDAEEHSYLHDDFRDDPDNIQVNDAFVEDWEQYSLHIDQEIFMNWENQNNDNIEALNVNIRGDSREYVDSISEVYRTTISISPNVFETRTESRRTYVLGPSTRRTYVHQNQI